MTYTPTSLHEISPLETLGCKIYISPPCVFKSKSWLIQQTFAEPKNRFLKCIYKQHFSNISDFECNDRYLQYQSHCRNLGTNHFSGSIPPTLGSLVALQSLWVKFNSYENLTSSRSASWCLISTSFPWSTFVLCKAPFLHPRPCCAHSLPTPLL